MSRDISVEEFKKIKSAQLKKESKGNDLDNLQTLFNSKNVRVLGDWNYPLFCCNDVAKLIGDTINIDRTVKKFYEEGLKFNAKFVIKKSDHPSKVNLFTEIGLYRYLTKSNRDEAVRFQLYVYGLLCKERLKVVDQIKFKDKIIKDMDHWNDQISHGYEHFANCLYHDYIQKFGHSPNSKNFKTKMEEVKFLYDQGKSSLAEMKFYEII
jgi:prophage antirepressor-like protein